MNTLRKRLEALRDDLRKLQNNEAVDSRARWAHMDDADLLTAILTEQGEQAPGLRESIEELASGFEKRLSLRSGTKVPLKSVIMALRIALTAAPAPSPDLREQVYIIVHEITNKEEAERCTDAILRLLPGEGETK